MLSKSNVSKQYYWCSTEITEAEYNHILGILRNKPTAPSGYDYRLTEELEWELYEIIADPEEDEEVTTEDYLNALQEMGVNV